MVQHADEVVDVVGSVTAGINHLGKRKERLRVVGEIVHVENGFRVGNVVCFQVGVEARPWSSDRRQ